jgi:hypothetical protein
MGFLQRPPLRRHQQCASTPGYPGPGIATSRARSVLTVPPGSDGLLRASPCRFVAPCYRPWGSPGFEPTTDQGRDRLSSQAHTLRSFSLRGWPEAVTAACKHAAITDFRTPLVVARAGTEAPASARPQGIDPPWSPLPACGVATTRWPDAPLGFLDFELSLFHARGEPGLDARCRSGVLPRCEHRVRRGGLPALRSGDRGAVTVGTTTVFGTVVRQAAHLANQMPSGPKTRPCFQGPSPDRAAAAAGASRCRGVPRVSSSEDADPKVRRGLAGAKSRFLARQRPR